MSRVGRIQAPKIAQMSEPVQRSMGSGLQALCQSLKELDKDLIVSMLLDTALQVVRLEKELAFESDLRKVAVSKASNSRRSVSDASINSGDNHSVSEVSTPPHSPEARDGITWEEKAKEMFVNYKINRALIEAFGRLTDSSVKLSVYEQFKVKLNQAESNRNVLALLNPRIPRVDASKILSSVLNQ